MKSFNKHILTAALLLLLSPAFAQVQKGYVRTVGRPDNREGERISGITIRVSGLHNAFVSGENGTFEFNLGGDKTEYRFTNILDNKFQYELQEKELLGRKEPVSATVEKEIVMVSLKEKQAIENKKREQIENQYQLDLKRLEDQLGQEKITIEKYREELQTLQEAFDKRDMLITDLTEHFAGIDYAKLSDEQARISALLEDGDLLTADSILNAKGDVAKRVKELLAFRAENTAQQEILNKKIEDERAGTADLMQDCESKFLIFEQQHQNDSAARYLELLVSLDTANVENLNRTGKFISEYMARYDKALEYFDRALRNAQRQYGEEHPDVAKSYNNIGEVYDKQGDYAKAMENYCTAYQIRHSILGADHPKTQDVANNIEKAYGKLNENPTEDSEKAIRLYEQWKEQYGGEK